MVDLQNIYLVKEINFYGRGHQLGHRGNLKVHNIYIFIDYEEQLNVFSFFIVFFICDI